MLKSEFYITVKSGLSRDALAQGFVSGCEIIAKAWAEDGGNLTDRKLAYVLATAYLETAFTMQPIEERGKGKGYDYGKPSDNGHTYYGRGFAQLTWLFNYVTATKKLGVDFVNNPALALQPEYAAKIIVIGMKEGWFTGKKLSDYNDFKQMRRIVNGTDKAAVIAEYAEVFNEALKAGAGVMKDEGVVEVPVKPATKSSTIAAGGAIVIIELAKQAQDALNTANQVKGQLSEVAEKLQTQSYLSITLSVLSFALAAYIVWERYSKPDIKKGGV